MAATKNQLEKYQAVKQLKCKVLNQYYGTWLQKAV